MSEQADAGQYVFASMHAGRRIGGETELTCNWSHIKCNPEFQCMANQLAPYNKAPTILDT